MKKNDKQCEEFVEQFHDIVQQKASENVAYTDKIRLFCQDESRFGILPVGGKRITDFGVKPIAQVDYQYEWFYLYGVVEPKTGESFFLDLPRLTADCFQIFIDQVSQTYSDSHNLLVLDNGRFHHSKALVVPQNVTLIFLPPYSPELNPIERLWQDIKANLFASNYSKLKQMQQKLTEILGQYEKSEIASITSFAYFVDAANAS